MPALERMVLQTGVGLIAGTMPHRVGSHGTSNRSWILLPDGKGEVTRAYHDKLVPTPSERTHGEWPIVPGKSLTLIEWRGLKLAVLICLDVEVPAVIARLQEEAIDLLIIPSQTELKSGYHRVFDCAKACAIEMFTSVAVMGGIGTFPGGKGGNCSGAAAYVPCEAALGTIGSIASIGPFDHTEGLGPLLFVDIPVATIRELRRNGPEAWPGPFSGKDMTWSRWKVEA